jgi:hypothetical protein
MNLEINRAVGQAKARVTINDDSIRQNNDTIPVQLLLYTDGVTTQLPEVTVRPNHNISLTSTEIRRPDHIPGQTEAVGIHYGFTKQPVDVRSTIVLSQSGYPHPVVLRIPPRHTLETVSDISTTQPADETLHEMIVANSPDEHPIAALSNFYRDAREILTPRRFFHVVTALEGKRLPREILEHPAWWVADWLLGYWGGRRATNEDEVVHCIETIQQNPRFSDVDRWGIFGEAICGPIAADELRATVPLTLQADVFDGRAWNQIVSAKTLAIVVLALNAGGRPDTARDLARSTLSLHTHDTYHAAKAHAKSSAASTSDAWARLLPTAADKSDSEWLFVLANAAYWIAEDARRNGYLRTATALHPVAAGLARRHDLSVMATKAAARQEYSYGLLKVFEEKQQIATDAFDRAMESANPATGDTVTDAYIWLAAMEQAAIVRIRQVQNNALAPTTVLTQIVDYRKQLASHDAIAATQQDQYDELTVYLRACHEDLTARVIDATDHASDRDEMISRGSAVPAADALCIDDTIECPRELAQQAHDKYQQVGRTYDANAIATLFNIS